MQQIQTQRKTTGINNKILCEDITMIIIIKKNLMKRKEQTKLRHNML